MVIALPLNPARPGRLDQLRGSSLVEPGQESPSISSNCDDPRFQRPSARPRAVLELDEVVDPPSVEPRERGLNCVTCLPRTSRRLRWDGRRLPRRNRCRNGDSIAEQTISKRRGARRVDDVERDVERNVERLRASIPRRRASDPRRVRRRRLSPASTRSPRRTRDVRHLLRSRGDGWLQVARAVAIACTESDPSLCTSPAVGSCRAESACFPAAHRAAPSSSWRNQRIGRGPLQPLRGRR